MKNKERLKRREEEKRREEAAWEKAFRFFPGNY